MSYLGYIEYTIKVKTLKNDLIKTYRCTQCQYVSKSINSIKNHVKCHFSKSRYFDCGSSKLEPYNCEGCGLKTFYLRNFVTHKKTIIDDKLKTYYCEKCDFQSVSLNLFVTHRENYCYKKKPPPKKIQNKWFMCESCDFKTRTKYSWANHTASKHTDPDKINWFYCEQCDYKAVRKADVKRHIYTKHNEMEWFLCDECDFRSKYKRSLDQHSYKTHKKLIFPRMNSAKKHKNTVEWLYCNDCSYKSKCKRLLRKHIFGQHYGK